MQYSYICLFLTVSFILSSCTNSQGPNPQAPLGRDEERKTDFGKLLGDDFLLFGGNTKKHSSDTNISVGRVNPFLWKATLEVLSFMPLVSADAVGGVILTDWYSAPDTLNERMKIAIYILDRQLRADAIQVRIFKQVRKGADWVNATVDTHTNVELENIILSKARQLRIEKKLSS